MYRESIHPDDLQFAAGALAALAHKAEAAGYPAGIEREGWPEDMAGLRRIARLLDNMAGREQRQGRARAEIVMPATERQRERAA